MFKANQNEDIVYTTVDCKNCIHKEVCRIRERYTNDIKKELEDYLLKDSSITSSIRKNDLTIRVNCNNFLKDPNIVEFKSATRCTITEQPNIPVPHNINKQVSATLKL